MLWTETLLVISLLAPLLLLIYVGAKKLRSQPAWEQWTPSLDESEASLRRVQDGEVNWCRLRDRERIDVFVRCGSLADPLWMQVLPSSVLVGESVVCRLPAETVALDALPRWSCWSWESIGGEVEITLRKEGSGASAPSPTTVVVNPALSLCGV